MLDVILGFALTLTLLVAYLVHVNRVLRSQPPQAVSLRGKSWSDEDIRAAHVKYTQSLISIKESLPPKTGNRYIVVGGSGFVGKLFLRLTTVQIHTKM